MWHFWFFIYGIVNIIFNMLDFMVRKIWQRGAMTYLLDKFVLRAPPALPHPAVWIHAVSLGENRAIAHLLQLWHNKTGQHFIITLQTQTAYQYWGQQNLPYIHVRYMPIDAPFIMKKFIKKYQPKRLIIVENELWLAMITTAYIMGLNIGLLNGRVSEKSMRRWLKMPKLIAGLAHKFTFCLAQSPEDGERLLKMGFHNPEYYGNLKFLGKTPPINPQTMQRFQQYFAGRQLVVFAQTHGNEHKNIAEYMQKIHTQNPEILAVVIPRHINKKNKISGIFHKYGCHIWRSDQQATPPPAHCNVAILNEMGILNEIYALADIAFIGGSLVKRGGHNPMEAFHFHCQVVFGPHIHNFKSVYTAASKMGIAHCANNSNFTQIMAQTQLNHPAPEKFDQFIKEFQCDIDKIANIVMT